MYALLYDIFSLTYLFRQTIDQGLQKPFTVKEARVYTTAMGLLTSTDEFISKKAAVM